MKCTGLQRIGQRDCNSMGGGSLVPQSDMAPFLADHFVSDFFKVPGSTGRLTRHAAISCSFQRNQLVLHIVHLDQSRTRRFIFEMK